MKRFRSGREGKQVNRQMQDDVTRALIGEDPESRGSTGEQNSWKRMGGHGKCRAQQVAGC